MKQRILLGLMLVGASTIAMAQAPRLTQEQSDSLNHRLDSLYGFKEQTLDSVTVTARKPLVKMATDRMTYDVQADAEAKTQNVLDMLRKVPMVTVDGQDNITVNGSASFKVLVNGKPNPMFNANVSQTLKSIPASMVKNIEVITNPGAKYDAEGVGGVLNLVFADKDGKEEPVNGYNGSVSATMTNNQYNGSAMVSGQQGRFTYSASMYHMGQKYKDLNVEMLRQHTDGSAMDYAQRLIQRNRYSSVDASLGYELDSMSTVSAYVGYNYFINKQEGNASTSFRGGLYGVGMQYAQPQYVRETSKSFYGGGDYQRYFNKARTHSITLSYLFSVSPAQNLSDRHPATFAGSVPPEMQTMAQAVDSYSDGSPKATEHTVQIDYSVPLSENKQLNAGVKYINRRNTSDSKYYSYQGDIRTLVDDNSVDYRNTQSILAEYIEATGQFGKWSTRAGLRYEHTWDKVEFMQGRGDNFSRHSGILVPSVSYTYRFKPTVNLGMNYRMGIVRPGIYSLNPYIDRSNPTMISYGNPSLEVEKSHVVELVFNSYTPKLMVNATLGQNFCNNQIESYSFVDNGVMNTTYGNVVKNRWTSFNTYINYNPWTKTRFTVSAGVDYGDIRSDVLELHNHGWQAQAYMSVQQTLPWELKLNLGTWLTTRHYSLQGYDRGSASLFFPSLTKSFLKDRLTVTVNAMIAMTGKLYVKTVAQSHDFEQNMKVTVPVNRFGITLTWNFGNTKKQFEKRQSRINNDFDNKGGQQSGSLTGGM